MSRYFSNNTNAFNTTNVSNTFTVADDRSNLLAWLSPLDPKLRHQDIRDRRVESVGEWLLQTEEFRGWCEVSGEGEFDNPVLFCYGDPGVGKTFISSLVIDSLCDRARGQNAAVSCFYFDFASQNEQSPAGVLGALLKQVVGGMEKVPGEIAQAYDDQKAVIGGRAPQLADIVKMLQITSSEKRTFICVDALDECVPGNRVKLLDSLNQILRKSPSTRIFVTGRPQITPEIRRHLAGRVTTLSISPKRDDIFRYLRTRLDEDTDPEAMDCDLEADILKKILDDISEIFLLVSLNIGAILQEPTISHRRQRLCEMTDGLGLGDAYGVTLGRIREQGGEKARLGMAALMWISNSERPLAADELCHALSVKIGSPNLDADNVPSIGTLLACCQGLIAVEKETSTVRFIHFTVQEYLRVHFELFGSAHSTMAETCLNYLNSQQVKALSPTYYSYFWNRDLQSTPFLEYSALYWGRHAKRQTSDRAKFLALKLFEDDNNGMLTRIILEEYGYYTFHVSFDTRPPFSGLHCACLFGIIEIVASLVEAEGCDVNREDCVGNTPLLWAAKNGHEGVVEFLLGLDGIDPNKPDTYGKTPLSHAASAGREELVKILLQRDGLHPNKPDASGQTPLSYAIQYEHEGVVKILLGRDDFNPDEPDESGRTQLSLAAERGWERVVKVLLEREDVNPNGPDAGGQTPLSYAVRYEREGVVKMLLGRDDISPDEPDELGRTQLSWAAQAGREGIVKILLERDDVDPDKPDRFGRTQLSWAAQAGREGVVKILLERDEVNPNKPDKLGRTPLWHASEQGHDGVVALLRKRI